MSHHTFLMLLKFFGDLETQTDASFTLVRCWTELWKTAMARVDTVIANNRAMEFGLRSRCVITVVKKSLTTASSVVLFCRCRRRFCKCIHTEKEIWSKYTSMNSARRRSIGTRGCALSEWAVKLFCCILAADQFVIDTFGTILNRFFSTSSSKCLYTCQRDLVRAQWAPCWHSRWVGTTLAQ